MKTIVVAALLTSMASFAFAHDKALGDNPELYGSVLLDHDTSPPGETMKGEGELYGSIIANPKYLKSDPNARVERWNPATDTCSLGDLDQSVYAERAC